MGKLATIPGANLVPKINAAHRAFCSNAMKAMEDAAECGRLLLEAKEAVPHGEWLPWLEANTEVDERQSQKYMRLANNWPEIESQIRTGGTYLGGINDALKLIAKPKAEAGEGDDEDNGERKLSQSEIKAMLWRGAESTVLEWVQEHPGRTREDYDKGMEDTNSEVWDWRRAKGQASNDAMRAAWLRDHPDNPLPEHLCSLSDEEGAAYDEWQAEREEEDYDETDAIEPAHVLTAYLLRAGSANEYARACAALMSRFREDPPKRRTKKTKENLADAVRYTQAAADAWAQLAKLMQDEYGDGLGDRDRKRASTLPQDGRSEGDPASARGRAA